MSTSDASIFADPHRPPPPLAAGDFGFINMQAAQTMISFLQAVSSAPIMTLGEVVREAQRELPATDTTRVLVVPGRDRNKLPFGGQQYDFLQVGGIKYKCERCASGGMCMLITDLHIFPECPLQAPFGEYTYKPVRQLLSDAVVQLFQTGGGLHCVKLSLQGSPPCTASRDHLCRA
jgi:hypothetical protein